MAEALAEYWHRRIREELGLRRRGRPGRRRGLFRRSTAARATRWGYPACPDLEDHAKIADAARAGAHRRGAHRGVPAPPRAVHRRDHRPPPRGEVLHRLSPNRWQRRCPENLPSQRPAGAPLRRVTSRFPKRPTASSLMCPGCCPHASCARLTARAVGTGPVASGAVRHGRHARGHRAVLDRGGAPACRSPSAAPGPTSRRTRWWGTRCWPAVPTSRPWPGAADPRGDRRRAARRRRRTATQREVPWRTGALDLLTPS